METTMTERKRSKAEERAFAGFNDALHDLEALRREMTLHFARLKFDNVPPEWAAVESAHPVRPRKVRINATYDADVAGFFRSMGTGYQARMNAVLRAYMLAIQSRAIASRKNEDWMGNEI
jgi:uncharacterized protein (DUF4415 family)